MPKLIINGLVFVLVVLALWSTQDKWNSSYTPTTNPEIAKSPNDQRLYKSLTLENNLTVLLISDPSTDKAAAAIDVNVGSSDDPKNFLGLAHFLEHMLFLGTEKYPDADEYQKYISEHGGSHNAFTSLEHTNYFFDINANSLEGALDRFSQQFTAPLFNEEYVEREVNAVHSEFSAKIQDDGRRYFSVVKELLATDHPYNKFSVGNLETLKDKENQKVRDSLLEFYKKHYSANQMNLVILGKEPIEILTAWAKDKFSNIANHNVTKDTITQPFFNENFLPAKANIKTKMDKRTMVVAFPVPSSFKHEQSQPLSYLSNLIGHEGKGSLLSYLKAEGLVNSLGAGSQFDTKTHAMMSITMELTPKGLDNQNDILNALFAYIDLVRKDGIKKQYFDEQAKMLEIAFKFQEKSQAIHYVSALSNALHDTEPHRVLSKGYELNHYNPDLYREFLSQLTPRNMLITLSAKELNGAKLSNWYEAPYEVNALSDEQITTLERPSTISALSLPEDNVFIPENTDFLVTEKDTKPTNLLDEEGIELWYSPDVAFGTPKANLFVTIRSPIANQTAKNSNLTELMVTLIKDELNEFSYPAYLAGLNYELYKHLRGVTIKISGYNDKQARLLQSLLEGIEASRFKDDRFQIYKARLIRSLHNAKQKKPFEQAISVAQRSILQPSWSEDERITALEGTDLTDLNNFKNDFFKQLDIAMLSTGNVTKEDSLAAATLVQTKLLSNAQRTHVARAQINELTGDQGWIKTFSVDHPDTGFVHYLQGDNRSFSERARFSLLAQLLSTDYYTAIRTEQQLGYIVFATNFSLLEVPALAFIIQSPTADGETLFTQTRQFLINYLDTLTELSDEDLARVKASVISRLSEKDNKLYQRTNRYWQEMDQENFDFNTREQLIAEVEKIDKPELISFYQKLIQKHGKGLTVFTSNNEEYASPEDLSEFTNASLDVFK